MSTAGSSSRSSQPDTSVLPSAPSVPGVDPSVPYLNENPGVCRGAWYERQRNGPGGPGGMPEHALAHPCSECGMIVAYKLPIRDWERHTLSKDVPIYYPPIAPRYQFESHMDTVSFNPFGPQLYGCWICFERHGQRCGPMTLTQWYEHHCGYHLRRGEIGCLDWYGRMQARKECRISNCPRLHT